MISPKSNAIDFLRHLPLFDDLTEEELQPINALVKYKKVTKHNYIFKAGDQSDAVFFLIKGTIKIGNHSDEGREVIKRILHPMAMFCELRMVGEENKRLGTQVEKVLQMSLIDKRQLKFNIENQKIKIHQTGDRPEVLYFGTNFSRINFRTRSNCAKICTPFKVHISNCLCLPLIKFHVYGLY